ncbi:polyamine aminopropyltransferase [Nisaea acidiphila]|uniref:Polyamine aminopropyltransferase n=1 Tax=Nisaea acidiphila TaxID=1862145 RepID=A0A9J7ANY2_9PROT|nr:polyamine aminopropyltransferase [Nisaea acidiphila]UUX48305.1 polyamine aminopropyltransferase [Nisaea acidiphila]
MSEWFNETLHSGYGQRLTMDKVLFRERTEHQDLVIFENAVFGRVMALDGIVQTTEGDEFVYHEMLTHVPILAHGRVKRVLIIGGGDGGMAREALRHASVEQVTMVEIDRSVVDMCVKHLPSISNGAFDNPRLDLQIADGAKFVEETDGKWDVIIVDSTDPIGPGEVLFRESFYKACKRCLTDGGILVTQNGVPFVQGSEVTNSFDRLGPHFDDVWFYTAAVPTYQGGLMAFGWATDDSALRQRPVAEIASRFAGASLDCNYYTPEAHVAAFGLPAFIRRLMRAK